MSSVRIKIEALFFFAVLQITVVAVHIENLVIITDRKILNAGACEFFEHFERLADRLEVGPRVVRRFRLAFVFVYIVTTESFLVKMFLDERSIIADLFLFAIENLIREFD